MITVSRVILGSMRVIEDETLLEGEVEEYGRKEVQTALSQGSTGSLPVIICRGGLKVRLEG